MVKNLKLSSSFSLFLVFLSVIVKSQTDTLYTISDKKISCFVSEIGESEISYLANKSVNKIATSDLKRILHKNGTSETFTINPKTKKVTQVGFNLFEEKTRNLIQKKAIKWGSEYLNCSFKNLSLNSTYVDWDLTYLLPGKDSILNIGLKSMYSIPLIEDREELFWSIKTNTKCENPRFNYNRSSNHQTILLNCISRLNSVSNP